jgi:hypothetical protein
MADSIEEHEAKILVTQEALQKLATLCEEAAQLVEGQFFESTDDSSAAADSAWASGHGCEDAVVAIANAGATYLAEAARLTTSVARLLRDGIEPPTAVYLLARGVAERVGRLMWILAGDSSEQRCIRAAFEHAVCYQHYVAVGERLKASKEDQKRAKDELGRTVDWLSGNTKVEKPPELTKEQKAALWHYPTPADVSTWIVNGEAYPSYGAVTKIAIEQGTDQNGAALYAGLSGFSHPNILFANEYRGFDDAGRIVFGSSFHSYDVAARLSAVVLLFGARAIAGYNSTTGAPGLDGALGQISATFDHLAAEHGGAET